MKRQILTVCFLAVAIFAFAQMQDPVKFTTQLKTGSGPEAEMIFSATIDKGWHVYSTNLGSDGPIEASLHVNKMDGAELVGKLTPRGKEISNFDEMFGMNLRYFENSVQFVQKVKFTKPQYDIDAYLEWGACNDEMCMPPGEATLKKSGKSPAVASGPQNGPKGGEPGMPPGGPGGPGGPDGQGGPGGPGGPGDHDMMGAPGAPDMNGAPGQMTPDGQPGADMPAPVAALGDSAAADSAVLDPNAALDKDKLWRPVISQLRALGSSESLANRNLLYILLMGFVGGLLAVAMPCIWPIIPMTVSFFLKRAKSDKKKGIKDAITYGLSIIVIYLALGLLVTTIFGSDTLNAMSTNAVFNIFLFLLLVVFALSFFGWFEIKLPSKWADSVDSKASNTSGLISIFLMAFTLVLVSFSCTAPIIGLLLVETTTSGNWLAPALGMLGFAVALALPFTLFALFPSWLKQAPKSGSWMTTIKVVLGFIELAFALKFFSVADLAYGWHLMDREVFLSLWIVIFAMLGAYLVGWLKFQEDEVGGNINKPMPVLCIMGGLISFAFAIYMVPGLWGAPCKAVSAFSPPINTQDFNLNTKTVEARFTDYEQGMAAARAEGKPVFIDFTGFGCVNCRKMEAAVWTDPRVADKLRNDYVLISLFVDDKTPLPQPFEVTDEAGNTKTLRTVGAKWSYLQSHKFGANAQPFYVIVDTDGNPLTGSYSYKEDIPAFLDYLNSPKK